MKVLGDIFVGIVIAFVLVMSLNEVGWILLGGGIFGLLLNIAYNIEYKNK